MLIIYRPSFQDYLESRMLSEMAVEAEVIDGKKRHVSSTNPLFFDNKDILYLYQFPPQFWAPALRKRYGTEMYEYLIAPHDYKEIQNVTIGDDLAPAKGRKSTTAHVFKKRQMGTAFLVNKMERRINIDHFANSNHTKEEQEAYKKAGAEKSIGKVKGLLKDKHQWDDHGYMGVDLSDVLKKQINNPKTGSPVTKYITRGVASPDPTLYTKVLKKWMDGSSKGLLTNIKDKALDDKEDAISKQGRKSKDPIKHKYSVGSYLEQIVNMVNTAAGWKVIDIVDAEKGKVSWNGIYKVTYDENKKVVKEAQQKIVGVLPVLYPGKKVSSNYESANHSAHVAKKIVGNFDTKDIQKLLTSDLEKELTSQIEERGVLNRRSRSEKGKEIKKDIRNQLNNVEENIIKTKVMKKMKGWLSGYLKEKGKQEDDVQYLITHWHDVVAAFQDFQHEQLEQMRDDNSYDAYRWNLHKFNRKKHPHDPFDVGENPVIAGKHKYLPISRNTKGYGSMELNKNQRSMIHGSEADWNQYFAPYFTDKEPKDLLQPNEAYLLANNVKTYISKLLIKLKQDNDPNIQDFREKVHIDKITNFQEFKNALESAYGLHLSTKSGLQEASKYGKLMDYYTEMSRTEKAAGAIDRKGNPIKDGVGITIGKEADPQVKFALEASRGMIERNALTFIKRNSGEAAFLNFKKAIINNASASDKYKCYNDLYFYIIKRVREYVGSVAQFRWDSSDTRRMRTKSRITQGSASTDDKVGALDHIAKDVAPTPKFDDEKNEKNDVSTELATYLSSKSSDGGYNVDNDVSIRAIAMALFGSEDEKQAYRTWFKQSDTASGVSGHALDTVYDMLDDFSDEKLKMTTKKAKQNDDDQKFLSNFGANSVLVKTLRMTYNKVILKGQVPSIDDKDAYNKYLKNCLGWVTEKVKAFNQSMKRKSEKGASVEELVKDYVAKIGRFVKQYKINRLIPPQLKDWEKSAVEMINVGTSLSSSMQGTFLDKKKSEAESKDQYGKIVVDITFAYFDKEPPFGLLKNMLKKKAAGNAPATIAGHEMAKAATDAEVGNVELSRGQEDRLKSIHDKLASKPDAAHVAEPEIPANVHVPASTDKKVVGGSFSNFVKKRQGEEPTVKAGRPAQSHPGEPRHVSHDEDDIGF